MEKGISLKVSDVTKRFPGVVALDHVSMEIAQGEIHSIIGENGAGKSTLCKILTGIYTPDEGEIELMGRRVSFSSPAEALNAGISIVHQERDLIPHFTGAQNICLGHEPGGKLFIDERKLNDLAAEIKRELGIDVSLTVPVGELGAGVQQIIEIMRAFFHNPRVIIFDEPTSSLSAEEIDSFLKFVKHIRSEKGISVIFISHKLEEVFAISDSITVFTEGKKVLHGKKDDLSLDRCISAMLKTDSIPPIDVIQVEPKEKSETLRVGGCSYDGKERKLDFYVCSGEAIGWYGLIGSGRTECAEAIFGIRQADSFDVTLNGSAVKKLNPFAMIQNGFIMIPERRAHAIFPKQTLLENIAALFWRKLSDKFSGFVKMREATVFSESVLKKNNVKYSNPRQLISELSGGNIQKTIIGRSVEIDNISVLVLDEPTTGLDLGAKHEVYLKIRNLVEAHKKSVIFISSEIEELIKTCDRIYIFRQGNIVDEFRRTDFDKERILKSAFGG